MNLSICSLASSSSGNSYLIKSDTTSLILDVGISTKKIKDYLGIKGIELGDLGAILVTHEHIDHVKSLKTMMKKISPEAGVYASQGTITGMKEKYEDLKMPLLIGENEGRVRAVKAGVGFTVGDIEIMPFNVSHDTLEPLAYSFSDGETKITVITDTGYASDEVYEAARGSDILIVESNHEPNILMYGSYPYVVKKRILSDYGHMSNEACGAFLIRILKDMAGSKIPKVFLAHLSQENNTPEQALLTVENLLEEEGLFVGKHLSLETLRKDEASRMISR